MRRNGLTLKRIGYHLDYAHLLALKLHVSKQELRHRRLYDWDDIVSLVVQNKLDLREARWRAVFEKYEP